MKMKKDKTIKNLMKLFGTIKDDEYDKIMKEVKPLWRKWTKRCLREMEQNAK